MSTGFQIEKDIQNMIRFGMDKDSILKSLSAREDIKDPVMLEEAVERVCEAYPDYDFIQFFMKSKIAIDKDGEDDSLYLYNTRSKTVRTIDKSRLASMISGKLDWNSRRYTCNFTYDPITPFKISKIEGEWKYNTYEPPFWQKEYTFSSGSVKIPKVVEIPKLYDKFLNHLVDNDVLSYNYVLDWLANSIQARNYCILTTIGKQGIGKGKLGDIMQALVGDFNFTKTDKRVITKDFNGQIKDKRIIYLDEIKITSTDQENKLKDLVNNFREVEQKGKDPFLSKNYSSIYYSSNNLDSIRLTDDDRRFSIVQLTEKKLIKSMTGKEIDSLTDEKNIEQLAQFLWHRKVDNDSMKNIFISEHTELIRSSSLTAWEDWLINEFAPKNVGRKIPVTEMSEIIEKECNLHNGPGRPKLISLSEIYAKILEVKNLRVDDTRKWHVVFKKDVK